jgi:hypothetical protein
VSRHGGPGHDLVLAHAPGGHETALLASKAARHWFRSMGVVKPTGRGCHYSTNQELGGTFGWTQVMSVDTALTAQAEATGRSDLCTLAERPRAATWADNRRIRDALDVAYNEAGGHYLGHGTDALLAAQLDVPRKWVTDIRASLYGPDANEAVDLAAKAAATKRADDLAWAQAQVDRLLELATEGEEIVNALRAALRAAT